MKKFTKTQQLTLSGLFLAIGLVLPSLFHAVPNAGKVFLPMHIPVLMAGLLLDPMYAVGVGILTPLLSNLITGMPPTFPMLPIMICELAAYGLFASLLNHKTKLHYMVVLVLTMLIGRVLGGLAAFVMTKAFALQLPPPHLWIWGSITVGLPGIIIQLILIPAIYFAINKYMKGNKNEA